MIIVVCPFWRDLQYSLHDDDCRAPISFAAGMKFDNFPLWNEPAPVSALEIAQLHAQGGQRLVDLLLVIEDVR